MSEKKTRSKGKVCIIVFIALAITLIITLIATYLCTGNMPVEQSALKYLDSTAEVNVSKIDEGYLFDGLGDSIAIIFYPGAKVEYTAYAELMYKIAQSGIDCFLVKMPFNLAMFGYNKADSIMNKYLYDNWYMSGHSLGGVVCASYAANHTNSIDGIVMLASYSSKKIPDDLCYISIYGSEDNVLNADAYNKAKKNLPENAKEYVIEGGNHSGFGKYGLQKGDGDFKISADEQIEKVVEILGENIRE